MEQLLTHVFADFFCQSDWMALNKSKRSWPCFIHVCIYTACFLILTVSWKALLVIGATHYLLDRYPIILKRIIWTKNHAGPQWFYPPFEKCNATGYYDNIKNEVEGNEYDKQHILVKTDIDGTNSITTYTPRLNYITIWLYIITDNSLHLLINYLALRYLT